jgi:uncharacterized membrane protein YheB (UPF0754 family)
MKKLNMKSIENVDSKSKEPTTKEKLDELIKLNTDSKSIINCQTAIGQYVFDLLKEANKKVEEKTDSPSKSNMEKLIMKLSLKELIVIIEKLNGDKPNLRFKPIFAKLTVNNDIYKALHATAEDLFKVLNKIYQEITDLTLPINLVDKHNNIANEISNMLKVINQKTENSKKLNDEMSTEQVTDAFSKILKEIIQKTENSKKLNDEISTGKVTDEFSKILKEAIQKTENSITLEKLTTDVLSKILKEVIQETENSKKLSDNMSNILNNAI